MSNEDSMLAERESWVVHKGKYVLRHDYSGLNGEEFVDILRVHAAAVQRRNKNGILALLVFNDTAVDKQVLTAFKLEGTKVKPHYSKIAMVGITGIQKLFVQVVSTFLKLMPKQFNSEEEALNWLVEDSATYSEQTSPE